MIEGYTDIKKQDIFTLWFYDLKSIGKVTRRKIIEKFGDVESFFKSNKEMYADILNKIQYEEVICRKDINCFEEKIHKMLEKGIKILCINHKEYPDKLRNIYDPPGILYIKGRLSDSLHDTHSNIAIVGSRNADVYGREMSYYFSRKLSDNNINIISGLAKGVDGCSHSGAIAANGYTVGVLGCGINEVYPRCNYELFMQIEEKGAIISEYGLDIQPNKINFPRRNRIISALSDGVLVIQASKDSGSLITSDFALEQGKQIYALPGRVFDKNSEGTNNLIKQGAMLVTEPQDIILDMKDSLYIESDELTKKEEIKNNLAPLEKMLYSCLSLEPVYIDDILYKVDISVTELISMLYSLEERGIIKQVERGYYIIVL